LSDKPKQDHHEIIRQHATDGWRLVQVFAPAISGTGFPTHFEIIFLAARRVVGPAEKKIFGVN
jgi:hypothetical protein